MICKNCRSEYKEYYWTKCPKCTVMKVGVILGTFMIQGCIATATLNTPQTPCHGKELAPGSCPTSTVLDMDGTACHHEINCGGDL